MKRGVVVRTRARLAQSGQVLAPRGFAFMMDILRVDGSICEPMAVQGAEQVAELLAFLAPERVSVEVAHHEDVDVVRAALGVADPRVLH